MASRNKGIAEGRQKSRGVVIVRPYPFCTLQAKWHGVDCPTMWPASRFAWCGPCADFEAAR